ncbi:MAG TPA: endolytic transglycosylase MltG [Anaerolineaceae bacterium]|nr:endolytic transglycosylase MltG [Anaerolineaceae bacterium]
MDTHHRRKRSILPSIFLIFLAVLGCGILAVLAWGYLSIPKIVADRFGPPSPTLGKVEQITLGLKLLYQQESLLKPVSMGDGKQTFHVDLGESVGSICYRLETSGLIPDADAFRTYLVYAGLDTGLQAGEYELSPGMSPVAIAHRLQDSTPEVVTFRILPGWRLEEIAAALPTSGLNITPDEFLNAARQHPTGYSFSQEVPEGQPMEGFFFPDSYRFDRKITVDALFASSFKNFDLKLTDEIRQGFQRQGLSLYQAVTLASIVQKEAVVPEEQPIIASVFFNRLAKGMKLDSDPTVQYALGYNQKTSTWWTNPLSTVDLAVNSAYNTYQNEGLPPGPICNPSLSALQAVAFPAQTPYYYFRASCDGSGKHEFSQTFEEHLQNSCP